MVKQHLMIIIAVIVAFGSFMLGYSLPPFLEVGFGGPSQVEAGGNGDNADLTKHYQELYNQDEE